MKRFILFVVAACSFLAATRNARAQKPGPTTVQSLGDQKVPWTVAIRPSAQSVAIGGCQLVYIDLKDESGKDIPRRPDGMRVSMADFDWQATGAQPDAAVGMYSGPSAWSACACQSAVIGSAITIIASYPAHSVPEKVRVPGLVFRSTVELPVSRALGASQPKGCGEAPATPATVAAIGTPLSAPMESARGIALQGGGRIVPEDQPPPPGPAPGGVSVSGTPAEAIVTWSIPATYSTPAPTGYLVERTLESNPACCKVQSPLLTARTWADPLMLSGSWKYTVIAVYADGRRGSSWNRFAYPEPGVPSNLTGEQVGRDSVSLTWQKVTGAAYYAVVGPPGNAPMRADSARFAKGGVPLGTGTWQVAAVYTGTSANAPVRTGPSASVGITIVPRRYRLVAEALRVGAETVDQPLSGDGKYDEVYVTAVGERLDRRNGQRIDISLPQVSALHGDISYWPPPQRVKAGTASGNGGIHQGDVVTPIWSAPTTGAPMGTPVFILWEGELIEGKQDLLLHPMVVEVDEPDYDGAREIPPSYAICPGIPCTWGRYFTGPAGRSSTLPAVKTAMAASQISVQNGDKMFLTGSGYFVHLENMDRDRPIGLEVGSDAPSSVGLVGMWRDKVVVLSREKIEAALAAGQNKVEVRFWDHWNLTGTPPSTVNYLNGDYTLVIRMERAP